jgi:type I restriction enzyme R subunit
MQDYTNRDRKQFGDPDINKTARVKFQEKLEICRDLLHGYNYEGWYEGTNPERSKLITGGVNYLLAPNNQDRQKDFVKESQLLHNAKTLCKSLLSQHEIQEVAYMDAVRVMIMRFTQTGGPITKQDINERIAHLIEQSIQSTGVINLFDSKREFSLFDKGFLEELRKMKERNLAVQLLEKLLKERIRKYERTRLFRTI